MLQHLQTAHQLANATKDGSPLLLEVVGRLCGLGAAERDALARKGVPGLVWAVGGLAGGVALGIFVQRRFPQVVDRVVGS
jgi:hypothetical protein